MVLIYIRTMNPIKINVGISKLFSLIFLFITILYILFKFLIIKNNHDPLILKKDLFESNQINTDKLLISSYSKWPQYLNFGRTETLNLLSKNRKLMHEKCLKILIDNQIHLSIETFSNIINAWSINQDSRCAYYYKLFKEIYDVKFKYNHLKMKEKLMIKVKKMLNNDETLFNTVYNQKLVDIFNRYTNEENVFNTLRPKRPVSKPEIPPAAFYEKTINETEDSCDFCSQDLTAYTDRMETDFSYSAANLFPFDENHELFLPKKHDLLALNFEEFKDLLNLPLKWFAKMYSKDPNLDYPVIMWDFLYKGGASQIHPHLHGTINSKRYYGMFETIRKGAENYYRETSRNYFNDFTLIHDMLNLTLIHKNSIVIFPLTPKKDNDVTILSDNFGQEIIELLYAILQTYFYDLEIYPFSLTIHFPFMNTNTNDGRIPVYVKILPRGDISSLRSDASTLELMTTFNANLDQFAVRNKMKQFIEEKLETIV